MPSKVLRCVVAATNSNGEPDLYFIKIHCTEEQYDRGEHYIAAKQAAEDEGYESFLAYDENDPGGEAMLPLFTWDSASVISI